MRQKTLQEQYNLIKEGKGSADAFMRAAKKQFPNLVRNAATLNETVNSLKHGHIISENIWGMTTGNTSTPDWFQIFNENIELVAEEAKAVEKKTSKEVTDLEEKNFDYKDLKNVDNVYGEAFLEGYYTEMKDPKNADKTVDELKEIVAKNLAKDRLHYVKDGQFGEKGVGYRDDLPGLKASETDQMVPVKENKMIKLLDLINEGEAAYEYEKGVKAGEKKEKKAIKKESTDSKLAEIEKNGRIATLEMQIAALDEIIEGKNQRISMVTEDDNLAELVDKKKMKEMQREVKLLEKKKAGIEKMYEKMSGKSYVKKEVVDETQTEE